MKKNLFITVIALFLSSFVFSQIQVDTVWTKTIGGSSNEPYGYNYESKTNVCISADNEIYMLTNTVSSDGYVNNTIGDQDCWLVKLNADGDTLWTKVFGGTNYDAATSIVALDEGGCVVAGFTYSNNTDFLNNHDADESNTDGFIAKFSNDGEIIWSKLYGGGGEVGGMDKLFKIIQNSDGNIYAIGQSSSINGDLTLDFSKFMAAWLLEVNIENGDKIVSKRIAGENHDEYNANSLFDIKQLTDNSGYIAIGTQTYSMPDNLWLVKIDNNADTIWTKEFYGSDSDNFPRGIEIDNEGNYIISSWITGGGSHINTSYGENDCWILKTNNVGEEIAQNTFGGSEGELIYGIKSDNTGGFYIYGSTLSTDFYATGEHYGLSDFWLVNFNSNLDSIFTYKIGGTESDAIQDIVPSETGEFIYLTGKTTSNDNYINGNNGEVDVWISKIKKTTPSRINKQISSQIVCYPNPMSNFIIIENLINEKITIFDITGRIVLSKTLVSNKEKIELNSLPNGLYLLNPENSNSIKIIKH